MFLYFGPNLYFPQEHFPVKARAGVRRAHGAQLQHGPQGSWFIPTLCQTEGTHLKSSRSMAPWEYCCFFLLLLSGVWALLLIEAMSKTATSASANFLSGSQIQLWAQQGAFKCSFPFPNKKESLRKWGWCVLGCQQAAWGVTRCQQSVSQKVSLDTRKRLFLSFICLKLACCSALNCSADKRHAGLCFPFIMDRSDTACGV